MVVLVHQLVLFIRILLGSDTLVTGDALLAKPGGEGMYTGSARMSLQRVRQSRQKDDPEATNGDDDRSPGIPTRTLSVLAARHQEIGKSPPTHMAMTLLLTPCPNVRYPTIPSCDVRRALLNIKPYAIGLVRTYNFVGNSGRPDRRSDDLVHPRLSIEFELVEAGKDLYGCE